MSRKSATVGDISFIKPRMTRFFNTHLMTVAWTPSRWSLDDGSQFWGASNRKMHINSDTRRSSEIERLKVLASRFSDIIVQVENWDGRRWSTHFIWPSTTHRKVRKQKRNEDFKKSFLKDKPIPPVSYGLQIGEYYTWFFSSWHNHPTQFFKRKGTTDNK